MTKKAQAAVEYLVTYGWAILIVIIVAAALYALGVFTPTPEKVSEDRIVDLTCNETEILLMLNESLPDYIYRVYCGEFQKNGQCVCDVDMLRGIASREKPKVKLNSTHIFAEELVINLTESDGKLTVVVKTVNTTLRVGDVFIWVNKTLVFDEPSTYFYSEVGNKRNLVIEEKVFVTEYVTYLSRYKAIINLERGEVVWIQ